MKEKRILNRKNDFLINDSASIELRKRILDVVEHAGRGHIGPALSILDILDVLYGAVMRNVEGQENSDRDRFILSKGHGCLALYVVLEKYGLIGNEDLESFCTFNSAFGGHPEHFKLSAIEFSTGALGHGPSLAVGLAMGAKLMNGDARIYVLIGDGELNEGSVWEAAAHAYKHKLNNLCLIIDRNGMQASGRLEDVLDMEPLRAKWEAFGFYVQEIDGHERAQIVDALDFRESVSNLPRVIIANTIKGKGVKEAENSPIWHHKANISTQEIASLRAGLDK
jgi:transketolase